MSMIPSPLRSLVDGVVRTVAGDAQAIASEPAKIEHHVEQLVHSVEASGEKLLAHAAVLEQLSNNVALLTEQLDLLLKPMVNAEKDVAKVEHLFHFGHKHADPTPPTPPAPPAP